MRRRQAAVMLLPLLLASMLGDSSQALSTFGVSNTKPPTVKPTPLPESVVTMWNNKIALLIAIIVTGWLKIQSADCFGISSFGKANTDPPKPATTTASPARACYKQTECAGISSSSCVRTHYDSTTRCLCGDNSPPLNGQCEAATKNLYHVCSNSDECNDGLICGPPNVTATSPPHLQVFSNLDKICLCDMETGFKEKDHACSDSDILKTSLFAVVIVTCIRKILVY
ncbi:hypothetical protein K1T71_000756 [Dendrolimus kikuchii]|uniref:Uncharacterized protein n=1 Tax=Dendrolimus kikuchii TaxID=765133 RepID=A0ACC1DKP8_9NEOP|nr:hypothetical protein K1T71_000756 [Dendrolimus kikuchii]